MHLGNEDVLIYAHVFERLRDLECPSEALHAALVGRLFGYIFAIENYLAASRLYKT